MITSSNEVGRPKPIVSSDVEEYSPLLGEQHVVKNENELKEISFKSIIVVLILSVVLSAANAYMGLFAGITVSVSIPSAILAMALLRPFNSNILEINAVQTGSAAGSSLAAGIIYTLPALLLSGYWDRFQYWETTIIAVVGGILGVVFSVPLRRVLIIENPLEFPEGVATAEVIKVSHVSKNRKEKIILILIGSLIGAISKFGQSGLMLWSNVFVKCWYSYGVIIYIACNLSPSLVAVGYIVKLKIAFLLVLGGVLNWWVAVPILSYIQSENYTPAEPIVIAGQIWSLQSRYIGVGAMLLGGIGVVFSLAKPLYFGFRASIRAYRVVREFGIQAISRTERDIPIPILLGSVIFLCIPMSILYGLVTKKVYLTIFLTFFMILVGFLFSAVGAYMAGLVGSSNNPISGITLTTMIVGSGVLLLFLGAHNPLGPTVAILTGAVVCCAAAIAGDNMQDLKAGYLVGSTPLVLQIMQLVGVIGPALVMSPIIQLLIDAYGIGTPTAGHSSPLPAPQASLMKEVTHAIFFEKVPWSLVGIGVAVASVFMFIDLVAAQSKSGLRVPVLSVALGLYLPLELTVPIFFGGVISHLTSTVLRRAQCSERVCKINENNGLLTAAGVITGEALVGIAIALPIVISGRSDVLAFFGVKFITWPGFIWLGIVAIALFAVVVRKKIFE